MIYKIDHSNLCFKNKDDARKAILERKCGSGINPDHMIILGEIFNQDGIKCGCVLLNLEIIPDMPEFIFEDTLTNNVWPMRDDGTIIVDPCRLKCCHPDLAQFFLARYDGPGFKNLKETMKGF